MIDREFEIAMERPGVDPTEAPADFEGLGVEVAVFFDGEFEAAWVVEGWKKAQRQVEALVEEFDGDPYVFEIREVYVTEDGDVEDAGYNRRTYRANPGILRRLLGIS